ncbi:MAG: hypothetical protein NXI18_00030 [Alphaproteobacteria bacterium]|nr:hypothetical protein [Alphaproteobacteria bacterium]
MNLRAKILIFSLTIGATAFVLAGLSAGTLYLTARDRDRLNLVRLIDRDIRDAETLATEILIDGGERPFRQWQILFKELSDHIDGLRDLPNVSPGSVEELQGRLQALDRAFDPHFPGRRGTGHAHPVDLGGAGADQQRRPDLPYRGGRGARPCRP